MSRGFSTGIVVAALLGVPLSTSAHHGSGISYDLTVAPVTTKATVTEFRWWNPHVSSDAAGIQQ